jgi:hypothetical protein
MNRSAHHYEAHRAVTLASTDKAANVSERPLNERPAAPLRMDHAGHRRRQKAAKSSDNAACADLCTRVCTIFGTCAGKLAEREGIAFGDGGTAGFAVAG